MTPKEILDKSLEDDRFSSHIHELDLFAERARGAERGTHAIPDRYGLDRCALLMVNPQRLFFYWEISGETKARFGLDEECILLLCVMREDQKVSCAEVRGDIGSYYLSVNEPFSSLYAVLLWRDGEGIEHLILRSGPVVSSDPRRFGGEYWMDKNGSELLRASLADVGGGSSGGIESSIGLQSPKVTR